MQGWGDTPHGLVAADGRQAKLGQHAAEGGTYWQGDKASRVGTGYRWWHCLDASLRTSVGLMCVCCSAMPTKIHMWENSW